MYDTVRSTTTTTNTYYSSRVTMVHTHQQVYVPNPTVPVRIIHIVDKYRHDYSPVLPLRSISHPVHTHQEVYVPNPTVPVRIIYIVDKCRHNYLLVLPLRSITTGSHPVPPWYIHTSRSTYLTQPYRYV
jgi:hypothetical protein